MAFKRRNKRNDRAKIKKNYSAKRYTEKTLREDREYGFYWYAWLWQIIRPVMIFACAAIIVIGIVSSCWTMAYERFLMPPEPNNPNTYVFEVEQGSSLSAIARKLEEENFVRNGSIFKYMVQFTSTASDIRYGRYYLSPSMEMSQIVDQLTSNVTNTERTITIIPGWTLEEIAEYLVDQGALQSTEEFLSLCNQPELFVDYCYPLREAYESGKMENRKYAIEGYLAPDTYRVFSTASAKSIIQKLVAQTNTVVDNVYYSQIEMQLSDEQAALSGSDGSMVTTDETGDLVTIPGKEGSETFRSSLSMDETLVLASVIEREAATKADYAKVSAVFHNRMQQGWRLESDATVSYDLGINKLNLTEEELNTESRYNTYTNDGLPIGPICNPSKAAIQAALHPDQTFVELGYMYFCSGNPENHQLVFARTKEEHDANVAQYRQLWIDYDEKQAQRRDAIGTDGDNAAAP